MSGTLQRQNKDLVVEGAKIVLRNFKGKEGKYNAEGQRNFHLLLDSEVAEQMKAEGWNIKHFRPREEGDIPQAHVEVSVEYRKGRPPTCMVVTSRGKTVIPEEMVELLDWVDIANVDMIINPYPWNFNGGSGIKAYLKMLVVTIEENYLEAKYRDVPDVSYGEIESDVTFAGELEDPNIIDAEIVEDEEDDE